MGFKYTNLLEGTRDWSGEWAYESTWLDGGTHEGFSVKTSRVTWLGLYKTTMVEAGKTYTFSEWVMQGEGNASRVYIFVGFGDNPPEGLIGTSDLDVASVDFGNLDDGVWHELTCTFTPKKSGYVATRVEQNGSGEISVCGQMLVEGTTPAAWAPAEGELLAGGGAQMSANLWQAESVISSETQEGGIYACSGTRGVRTNVALDRLAENQTFHCGFSVNPGADDAFSVALCYRDAAGSVNYAFTPTASAPAGKWTRVGKSVVVPSGMTVYQMVICNDRNASGASGWKVTNPTLSLGSPVVLASDAHTPYATQDHLRSEYATKAALKVTSDAVTAEVTERGKLAGRVGTLESTSGTHTSKLQQLAASITSLVRGESTYTDPDGKSATSGIYSLVTQTRDSVTALFGQYTKTADLASTQAVKDAKKAGTDAQAAASAAQSTADSLATMIRDDATGITVGKSADGETWSTGRTHMDEDSFDILDKAGNVLSSFGANLIELGKNSMDATISMLAGLVKIQARNDGSNTVASISSDFLSLDSLWKAVMRAGKETSGAHVEGYAAAIAEVTGRSGSARLYCTQGNGSRVTANNAFTVTPNGYDLSQPEYLAAALLGTGSGGGTGITHSQDAVTMTPDLDTCGPGVFSYNTSTTSRPTDYGTCVCIRAGGGTTSTWLFQLALPTSGDPHWRRNINGAGWEGWWTITSQ